MMPPVAGSRTRWTVGISIVVIVLVGLWGAAFFFSSRGSSGSDGQFNEETVDAGTSSTKVAMINIVGEIFSDPEGFAEGASDANIIDQLDQAQDDSSVKAIILRLDTPGGGVVASDAISSKVRKIRKAGKPVVALMGDVAASGGYYIAASADEIIASPSTWTGSIGVIAMLPNVEKAAEKIGVSVTVIKSGKFKDIGSLYRAMTPEEQGIFQGLIDEAYDGFVKVVATGRRLSETRVRELADGRIYSGSQAKGLGLVDRLGDVDVAFSRAKILGRAPDASLVRYTSPGGLRSLLGVNSALSAASIKRELGIPRKPGAAYLWLP